MIDRSNQGISTETASRRKTVGMDMVAPYGVYLNGEMIAEHATEHEASALFERLHEQTPDHQTLQGAINDHRQS